MALKKNGTDFYMENALQNKTKQLFSGETPKQKENKILTTFSIEPSFKKDLEDLFSELGLGWAAGIRFALKEFYKKYQN